MLKGRKKETVFIIFVFFQRKRRKIFARLFCMQFFFFFYFSFLQSFSFALIYMHGSRSCKMREKKISLYLHLYYRIYITHSTHDTMGCKSWSIDSIRYYYMYTCANILLNKNFQMWQKVKYACGCVCEICNCLNSGFYVNGVR